VGAFFPLPSPRIAPPLCIAPSSPFKDGNHFATGVTLEGFDAIGFDDLVDAVLGVSLKSLVQNRPRPGLTPASPVGTQFKKNGPPDSVRTIRAPRARPCTLPTRTRERHNSSRPKLTAKLHGQFPLSSPANSTTARLLRTPALSLAASLSP